MTISYPLNFFEDTHIFTDNFELKWVQQQSMDRAGRVFTKDLGDPIWIGAFNTGTMSHDDCVEFQARLNSLRGSLETFSAYDTRRPYPRTLPQGGFDDSLCTLFAINGSRNEIRVDNIPTGLVPKIGDKLAFTYDTTRRSLHEVVEQPGINGSNVTTSFEVRPNIPVGVTTGTSVTFSKPDCEMNLRPGSLQYADAGSGMGIISFQGVQSI